MSASRDVRVDLGSIDAATARRLLREYSGLVAGVARGDEDLAQVARIAVLEAYVTHRPGRGRTLKSWVHKVVRWRVADAWQRRPVEALPLEEELLNGAPPDRLLEQLQGVRLARQYVDSLSPRLQTIYAAMLNGETPSEIAHTLGITPSRLRQVLQKHRERRHTRVRLRPLLELFEDE
jgi:RNA polymerase sigma factor (sigma-70 family)